MLEHHKGDFMKALECFYRRDMRGLSAIDKDMVSFLPTKDEVMEPRDFCPASLVHWVIKNFDEVLSSCLSAKLPILVGMHQSAFVQVGSIHKLRN